MLDGFITLAHITLLDGDQVTAREAKRLGLIHERDTKIDLRMWPSIGQGELPIGTNIHTDDGRQYMIYCFGGKAPLSDFVASKFGLGTGITPETSTDQALESPLTFYDSNADSIPDSQLKPLNSIDYPEPFIARASLTIGLNEANGVLITEFGLFSGNGTLLNRAIIAAPFNKTGYAKTYLWRLRF